MPDTLLLLNPPVPRGLSCVIRDFYCSFSSKADYYWPPQDLLAFSGMLRNNYHLEVVDAVSQGLSREACLEKILRLEPAAVLFSTGSVSLSADMDFAATLKRRRPVKLVASSSLFHVRGEQFLQRWPVLDAVVGDFTDLAPLERVLGPREPAAQPGSGGEFSLGRPWVERFIGRGRAFPFFGGEPFAVVISWAGWKLACAFCVSGTYRIRYRQLAEVMDDLRAVKELGIRKVFFPDPLFTADPDRVQRFCEAARGLGMEWIANAHAATIQDEGLLGAMKAAGCRALLIGVESGDDAILQRYHKGVDTPRIRRAFALARKYRIQTLAYFIIGLPGEGAASIRKTIALSRELDCDYASFGCATPDEGTPLREEAVANGWCGAADVSAEYDSSRAPALATPELSREEARIWLNRAYGDFYLRPQYIARAIAGIRSPGDLQILCRSGWALLKRSI